MKKLALSMGLLLNSSPLLALQLPTSNVSVISFSRTLEDSKIALSADTNDIDTLQTFEIAELNLILGNGTQTKSEIFLSKNNQVNVKINDELVAIGTLDQQKNLELAQGLLPEYDIEKDHYTLKVRFPAIAK